MHYTTLKNWSTANGSMVLQFSYWAQDLEICIILLAWLYHKFPVFLFLAKVDSLLLIWAVGHCCCFYNYYSNDLLMALFPLL